MNVDKLITYGESILKEYDVKNTIRLYFIQLVNLTMLDFDFNNVKIQFKKRKITVTKYISIIDDSINKLIHLFLELEKDHSGIHMDIDILIDLSNRLRLISKYENGLQFLRYLHDDIEPLEVYILILQEIKLTSKIIPTVSIYKEALQSVGITYNNMNKPHKKTIFNIIHNL